MTMENVSRTTLLAQAAPSPRLKSPRHRLDNTKRKGELSEAAFLLKAASLGFGVAKPWGDSERYDFILDPHTNDPHGPGDENAVAPPLSRPLRQGGDLDSPTLSSRAKSRDLVVPVAPPLSRSLRQGGTFDSPTLSSRAKSRDLMVPVAPPLPRPLRQGGDFDSPTLSSRAKSRDLVVPVAPPLSRSLRQGGTLTFPPDQTRNLSPTKNSAPHPRLWRVQLKCTDALRARGYDVQPIYAIYGQGKRVYTANDIDVLVAHIVPLDVWYVLPVAAFSPCK